MARINIENGKDIFETLNNSEETYDDGREERLKLESMKLTEEDIDDLDDLALDKELEQIFENDDSDE